LFASFEPSSTELITPYSEVARYDLDIPSSSLAKYYENGRYGAMYPDMQLEPKESFKTVARYFASH